MMVTSPEDRIAALLGGSNISRPKPPVSGELTFAEKELESQLARQAAWQQPKLQIQQTQQTQQEPQVPATKSATMHQPLSDSESDEYVAAFAKKPSMKSTKISGKGRHVGRTSDQTRKGDFMTDAHLCKELPTSDERGNPVTGHFCVLSLVAKFPYKYMVDSDGRVSRHFFSDGKFYERTWDLYYVHPPESPLLQPLFLLPYDQVKALIDEIGQSFEADVAVPAFPFTLTFFEDGTPQPKLLGTSTSRNRMDDMQDATPPAEPGHGEVSEGASIELKASFAAFRAKFERAVAATKKSSASKKKKAADRVNQIGKWCLSLNRSQRYLGLLPPNTKLQSPDPDMPWPEQVKFMEQQDRQAGIKVEALDVSKAAPFDFDKFPVFVCPDIEAYERAHHLITEVGISTLDTLDLVGLPPGENGKNWRKHIRSRHFRIVENAHFKNTEFCLGDPDAFQFGTSEFVSLADVGDKIDSCFEWPFSVQHKHDGKLETEREPGEVFVQKGASMSLEEIEQVQKGAKDRNILLAGHDLDADLTYLAQLGSSIFSAEAPSTVYPPVQQAEVDSKDATKLRGGKGLQSIKDSLDTATLYKVLTKDQQTKSLAKVLYELELRGFFLHNGGNDARYTLDILVALIIKARTKNDKANAITEAENAKAASMWTDGAEPANDDVPSTQWDQEKQKSLAKRHDQTRQKVE